MASAKIEKGSEEWQVFMDYWQFIQKYYAPDNNDSWWDEVVKAGESLINKYKGMEIEERARQLVLSHFAWLEITYRKEKTKMSNALRRKKKPTFYTKQEMRIIGQNDFEKRNADKVISKSYKEFVVIGYIILHDKFGFGQARIIRLQDFLKSYLDEAASGGNTGKDLSVYLKSKYGINIKEEVGKIPQRQLMNMYAKKGFCIEREAYRLSSASLFNYFALTLTILKKEFKITAKQLQYFTDKFIDYIDTLANYKQFQLTVPMIAQSLADEIKFVCDLEV